jgi:hypothetical protein
MSALYDYVCAAEYHGESKVIVFILTLPEDQHPSTMTNAETLPLFLKHWTKKRPCPGGLLHMGLPAENMKVLKAAIIARECITIRIDAVDLAPGIGKPN